MMLQKMCVLVGCISLSDWYWIKKKNLNLSKQMAISFAIKSVHSDKDFKVARCQLLIVFIYCGYPNPCIHSSI